MDLCRLCGITTSFKVLCELNDSDLMIELKLQKVFNIILRQDKLLPQMVCGMCIAKLENSLSFLEQIEESQEKLVNSLSDQLSNCESSILFNEDVKTERLQMVESFDMDPLPTSSSYAILADRRAAVTRVKVVKKKEQTSIKRDTQAITLEDIFPKELSEGIFGTVPDTLNVTDSEKNPDGTLNEVGQLLASKRGWLSYDWRCIECNGIFNSSKSLEEHFKADHSQSRVIYACMDCPATFKMSFGFLNHVMDAHRPQMKFFCDICSEFRWNLVDLYKHRKEFHPKNRNTCLYCGRMFVFGFNLKQHVAVHMKFKKDQLFSCDLCGAKVHTKHLMQRHVLYHHVGKKHICEHCGKAFSRLGDLKYHKVSHSTERPYSCELCEMRFKDKNAVRCHKRTHFPKEKTEECTVCGMKFLTKGKLNRHFRIHTDEFAYTCEFCDRKFKHASGFQTHRRIHTGERPYICSYEGCGQAFIDWPNMNKHMKNKHSIDISTRKKHIQQDLQ